MISARPVLLIAFAFLLSGCAEVISDQESRLAAAGFRAHPADTPERQAMLADLPAHQFVRQFNGDWITYTYADPTVCHCLYEGSRESYVRWRRMQLASTRDFSPGSSAAMPGPPAPRPPPPMAR
jgi:hypothetical protein